MKESLRKSNNIDVSFVIVTMNHIEKLKNLLHSIDRMVLTRFSHEIIIVDNCSSDGTVDYVSTKYPKVRLNVNNKIHGFAYNNNFGASKASGDYVFICNPDVIVLPDSLEKLILFAIDNPRSGIVCPQLLNSDLTYQPSVRAFHSLKIVFWRLLSGANDNSGHQTISDYLLKDFDKNSTQQVDWALGAAMLLKRDFYHQLNGFDEKFFLYVEDEDLCLRTWKMNYDVTYYPGSVMIHDHQKSSSTKLSKLTWYHLKSFLYFMVKHNLFFTQLTRENLKNVPLVTSECTS